MFYVYIVGSLLYTQAYAGSYISFVVEILDRYQSYPIMKLLKDYKESNETFRSDKGLYRHIYEIRSTKNNGIFRY